MHRKEEIKLDILNTIKTDAYMVPCLSGRTRDTSVAPQLETFKERSPFLSSNNLIWSFSFLAEPLTNPEAAKKRRHSSTKILVFIFLQRNGQSIIYLARVFGTWWLSDYALYIAHQARFETSWFFNLLSSYCDKYEFQ